MTTSRDSRLGREKNIISAQDSSSKEINIHKLRLSRLDLFRLSLRTYVVVIASRNWTIFRSSWKVEVCGKIYAFVTHRTALRRSRWLSMRPPWAVCRNTQHCGPLMQFWRCFSMHFQRSEVSTGRPWSSGDYSMALSQRTMLSRSN